MKKAIFILISLFVMGQILAQSKLPETNDFYDNDSTFELGKPILEISGEVANPGKVDLSKLPMHSEIIKEATLNEKGDTVFIGAFRYDGYSLYDILNNSILKKKNEKEFSSVIDLYVEIENNKGEKVVVSWGEIYYPVNRHKLFFATKVMRIVPSKTKDLWTLPKENKFVVATDLVTERNISNPVKITVKSYSRSYVVNKDLEDKYSKEIAVYKKDNKVETISKYPNEYMKIVYNTVFYGRGRGIHGITQFNGIPLKNVIGKHLSKSKKNIQSTLIAIVGKDGYRCIFTYSELFNRNDFQNVLLIDRSNDAKDGAFSIFSAPDFFSDRAIKDISEIRIED